MRDELEDWYAGFPAPDNVDLRRRFRSRSPSQHFPAWWELYLHRFWSRIGARLTVHPKIRGQSGRPDFLVEHGDASFYVEAVTVFSGIAGSGRRAALRARIQDAINEIDAPALRGVALRA